MPRSLCSPDKKKSCFACCPPIRSSQYEHLQYKKSLQRILRENTYQFDSNGKDIKPITGYSCWALGYLDKNFRLVGCLLHPAGNRGEDLRYRIDYGEKCRRESCQESGVFSLLDSREQTFWLHLCQGLDSFAYSSRTKNILFRLLNWGPAILKLIAAQEQELKFDGVSFIRNYPFFTIRGNPKALAYLLNSLINRNTLPLLKKNRFKERFAVLCRQLEKDLVRELPLKEKGEYIHRLEMNNDFLNFLRLSFKRTKMERGQAERLKEMTDKSLRSLKKDLKAEFE